MSLPPPDLWALEMRGVAKRFGATVALDGVHFRLASGEVHALLGENGAGKSTLMKILSGALRPDGGEMRLAGKAYQPADPGTGRRRGVSMIYQELTLAPHLTVAENITLGREDSRRGFLRPREARRRVREALDFLNHPEIEPETPVRGLGQGARQIVEISRALLDESSILVLDEPTSSLTRNDTERLFQVIRKLRDEGVAIVYISHFLEEVRVVADRYTVLRDGRNAGEGVLAEASLDGLVESMVGRKMGERFPRRPRVPGETILSLTGLKGAGMAAPVSLDLRRGEILGAAGLVGSGRTETLRTIFGLDPLESGAAAVAGRPGGPAAPWDRIAGGMGLMSEDRQGEGLALSRSVADNVTLSRLGRYRRCGLLDLRERSRETIKWMEALRIKAGGTDAPVFGLSGGNQQKVALARLLHQDADILLLDEPTRGIDVPSKAQIYDWMDRLAASGKALLFVSSTFSELLGVCDRIAVFHRGRLVALRPAAEWTERTLMAAAITGKA